MIDEELYQKAADELNSEHRRPHIWARACALADDDHDEARYLYTNLRVEELLAEAERGGGAASIPTSLEALDDELALEPVELESLPEVGDGRVESFAAGQGTGSTPLPGALDDGTPRPASTRARMSFDLENDAALDLDPDDVRRLEEARADGSTVLDEPPAPDPRDASDEASPADGSGTSSPDERVTSPADEDGPHSPDEGVTAAAPDEDGTISLEDVPGSAEAAGDTDGSDPLEALFATGETVRDLTDDASVDAAAVPSDPLAADEPADATSTGRALVGLDAAPPTDDFFAAAARHDDPADPPFDDPADDSVVETIDPDDVGIDDTIALDPGRAIPGRDDAGAGKGADPLDDLDWLDEAYRAERQHLDRPPPPPPSDDDDGDPLTRELRRQAEELPDGGTGSVIAHESPDTLPVRRVGHDVDESHGSEPIDAPADAAGPPGAPDDAHGAFALTDGPLEITDERGGDTEYAVFVDASGKRRATQAVRQGGSWGALVATVPWLLHRRLIGTAIVYVLFAVVVLAGLASTAIAWQEAGAAASSMTKAATVGFALLALAGLVIVPFRNANHWREDKLERRGFDLVAYVRTRDRERAVALATERDGRRVHG